MGFEHMVGGVRAEGKDRNENDYYPTPPFITYALLRQASVPKVVLEPAAGRGWMAYELKRNHHLVYASDMHKYDDTLMDVMSDVDFLSLQSIKVADAIITNPPYAKNMAQKFIDKSLDMGYKYVAMLCRATFFESDTRYQGLFSKRPPSNIYFFSRRFSCNESMFFTDPFAGMVAYAWWVWDARLGKINNTQASWIDTKVIYDDWINSLEEGELQRYKSFVRLNGDTDGATDSTGEDSSNSNRGQRITLETVCGI